MQTLTQIRAILADAGLSPQHRFGQNFLIDHNLMRKLLAAAEVSAGDVILEVGPGTGALTEALLETGAAVIAVEIDRGLHSVLNDRLGGRSGFTLIGGDALAGKHALNPDVVAALRMTAPAAGGARKLVANLPYQIATPLIMELLIGEPALERMVATIQKEVAQRLTAPVGDEPYGPLAVIAQTLARVENVATLPPSAFWPSPDVDSRIVRIRPLSTDQIPVAPVEEFVQLVRDCFLHRRKTLRRILRDAGQTEAEAALTRLGFSGVLRPEQLSPSDWQAFFRSLAT